MDYLLYLWEWTVAPVPIILALLLYFIPVYWRKYRSDIYTPIYFSIYPLDKLNIPLSRYLGESFIDDYMDDNVAEREKKIIKIKSVFSSVIFVIVIPFFLSITWGFLLTWSQFIITVVIVLGSVLFRFVNSIRNFSQFTKSSRRGLLSVFYGAVTFVFFYILLRTYYWISPLIKEKDYWGIITTIGDFLILEVIISVLVVGILIPVTISLAFDKRVRRSKLEQYQTWQESTSPYMDPESGNQKEPTASSDHPSRI